MPLLGLGTWRASHEQTKRACLGAFRSGYRLVDTASRYRNEAAVGEAVAEAGKTLKLPRNELFVTTKLAPDRHEPVEVAKALEESLRSLDTSYVDLYLVHFPLSLTPTPVPLHVTWKAMLELRNAGLARDVGVSNVAGALLNELLASCDSERDFPSVLQIERHPLLPQTRLVKFAQSRGIAVTAFSSLGTQEFATSADGSAATANAAATLFDMAREVAEDVGRTPAQVLLRWSLQSDVAVIPKSSREERIAENSRIFDFQLSAHHLSVLNGLVQKHGMQRFLGARHIELAQGVPLYE